MIIRLLDSRHPHHHVAKGLEGIHQANVLHLKSECIFKWFITVSELHLNLQCGNNLRLSFQSESSEFREIRIIENMHYCDPDSLGSWPKQNLHPGPSWPANTHYIIIIFYEVSEPGLSLLKSLTENWNWEKFWPAKFSCVDGFERVQILLIGVL